MTRNTYYNSTLTRIMSHGNFYVKFCVERIAIRSSKILNLHFIHFIFLYYFIISNF